MVHALSPRTAPRPSFGGAPSFEQAMAGRHLRLGQSGDSIFLLQASLAGSGHPVPSTGRFDLATREAVRAFQRANGCQVDGIVGPETLRALGHGRSPAPEVEAPRPASARAPRVDDPAPAGSVKAGRLALANPPARARAVATVQAHPEKDRRLAEIQRRAVEVGQREIDAGVKADPGTNTSARIRHYANKAGMEGGAWCGYFAGFTQTTAAEELGMKFTGQKRLHSVYKNYKYFTYGSDAATKRAHAEDGQTRQLFVLEGTKKPKYFGAKDSPRYKRPEDLPIRPGDTVLFTFGHVGVVKSYDPKTGLLETVEGNRGRATANFTYDLSTKKGWGQVMAFGRPAPADFVKAEAP